MYKFNFHILANRMHILLFDSTENTLRETRREALRFSLNPQFHAASYFIASFLSVQPEL